VPFRIFDYLGEKLAEGEKGNALWAKVIIHLLGFFFFFLVTFAGFLCLFFARPYTSNIPIEETFFLSSDFWILIFVTSIIGGLLLPVIIWLLNKCHKLKY